MSWNEELYRIYEYNSGREFDPNEPVMLPVAHSTANAQIEIIIDIDGNFKGAGTVAKADAVTVIPATEDSAARSSDVCPMPFADKLIYIAGDYGQYANGKKTDNTEHFTLYMDNLGKWCASGFSNKFVDALYKYLEKRCLIHDLIEAGIIKTDETDGKFKKNEKISGIAQEDSFVRVIINTENESIQTWRSESLRESFISFNNSLLLAREKQLCYASGEYVVPAYKHPSKILDYMCQAKLICAGHSLSVGYYYSQKIHNALRWLIKKQGEKYGSMTVILWASAMQDIPPCSDSLIDDDDLFFEDENNIPSTMPMYADMLKKRIFGYGERLASGTKVMIMGLDAATTGRINISMYSELESSGYLANIEKWHSETAWLRYSSKHKKKIVNSFGLYEIVRYAFGSEQGSFVECDEKVLRDNILRLINCVVNGNKLPADIVNALYQKASNPLAYDIKNNNHRRVLETACGMIRKQIIDRKGDVLMAYDPNETDRSYLYGCLLAIADKAESESYDENERNVRITNARRYWNAFSQRPYQTWGIIEERLRPYLNKLGRSQVKYGKWINEIASKMDAAAFRDNSRLEPMYLLGYHNFTEYMYNMSANKEEK